MPVARSPLRAVAQPWLSLLLGVVAMALSMAVASIVLPPDDVPASISASSNPRR